MPRINLLPWREELRQKRKKDFLLSIVGAVLVGFLVVYGSKMAVQHQIASQQSRNAMLTSEIAILDQQIEEISGLETQKNRLLARMEIIDQLQRSRPEVVHLFDELVDAIPDGLHFTELKQTGGRIDIKGEAQSSTRVSALMNNIDDSNWLANPGLDVVETVDRNGSRNARFTLFAQQVPMAEHLDQQESVK